MEHHTVEVVLEFELEDVPYRLGLCEEDAEDPFFVVQRYIRDDWDVVSYETEPIVVMTVISYAAHQFWSRLRAMRCVS